eukprot:CAMPEP_0194497066 /NCGR_PEP_ID=MMETSP0253-20130528/14129_1 /TAXON_ID=2966 /ORGANISM="Noctiluca scintillans" /LENGTH=89 /DNA_ID=CAMNT_0039338537 /DNA_START=1011 /DNA_END=1278 /DNA_ORIENTATION=-
MNRLTAQHRSQDAPSSQHIDQIPPQYISGSPPTRPRKSGRRCLQCSTSTAHDASKMDLSDHVDESVTENYVPTGKQINLARSACVQDAD